MWRGRMASDSTLMPGGIHMLTVAHLCLTGFRLWYGSMWWIHLSSSGSFGAGYALDSVPVCHRAHKETYSFMLAVIHTWQNLDSPANLTYISLGCGGSRGAQRDPTQTRLAPAGRGIWTLDQCCCKASYMYEMAVRFLQTNHIWEYYQVCVYNIELLHCCWNNSCWYLMCSEHESLSYPAWDPQTVNLYYPDLSFSCEDFNKL